MIIDIELERSEAREVLLATYDLLGENEKGCIFRDSFGVVFKESPGHIILEVSDLDDDTGETVLYFWKDGRWQKVEGLATQGIANGLPKKKYLYILTDGTEVFKRAWFTENKFREKLSESENSTAGNVCWQLAED